MTHHHEEKHVPFTPAQMFKLVADVEAYPDFIPWCEALRIVEDKRSGPSGRILADMIVGYKVFRERFRSDVLLDDENKIIEARYIEGPMKNLYNRWTFNPASDGGTLIDFVLEFEFKNFILQAAAGQVFDRAFAKMVGAFTNHAYAVYGDPSA